MNIKHLSLTLLAAAALCSCGGQPASSASNANSSETVSSAAASSEAVSSEVASSSEAESDPLAWNDINGTARVDIFGDIGITLSYGGKTVSNGDYIHLTDAKSVDWVGAFSASTYNFVYVLLGNDSTLSTIVNPAIDKDSVSEYMTSIFAENLKGKAKGYIAISTGSEVLWNKNLSEAMNKQIEKLILK